MHHYTIIGIFYDSQQTILLDITTKKKFQLPEQSLELYAEATKQRIGYLIKGGVLTPEDDPSEHEIVADLTWIAAIEGDTSSFNYTTDWKDAI